MKQSTDVVALFSEVVAESRMLRGVLRHFLLPGPTHVLKQWLFTVFGEVCPVARTCPREHPHCCHSWSKTAAMPKVKRSKGGGEKSGAAPVALADQILQADIVRAKGRVKIRDTREESDDKYVDERLSRKILQQARIQQEELQTEYGLAPEKKKAPVTVLGNVGLVS